ncbi:Bifunctional endo-1,4-beta-xylanase xylA precursor-related protein [Trichomonas vaginalis G3]|uniref:Bifunctional endo-1,4-beta-xylanase xylA-related protein n=1 Tax=Trichomonas vaginalis (strain ATCC PRA-98 / G3) TaxID=412133 RepID=A2FUM7_TRIV3|nr:hypothetical protein TVAGG3_0899700 [Trichomonas vaginalis G3]EAX91375.1 Bifunctional endo-1,4-beta-xylanase xylA precursor-related protein [Trichomonas vaginalis G3]KAI5483600.1 hypothetical protein TVAGG3_0899700 [Trichomonas vaginalis G3]|eukprot:XP_001304305.1 Bifunctional endo-1,4-beta-xylanase xylA precursor-related protein [Trichomonas vaginalis G3]
MKNSNDNIFSTKEKYAVFITHLPKEAPPDGVIRWVKDIVSRRYSKEINISNKIYLGDGITFTVDDQFQFEMILLMNGSTMHDIPIWILKLPCEMTLLATTFRQIFEKSISGTSLDFSNLAAKFLSVQANSENIDFSSRWFVEYMFYRIAVEAEERKTKIVSLNLSSNKINNVKTWNPYYKFLPDLSEIYFNNNIFTEQPDNTGLNINFITNLPSTSTAVNYAPSSGSKPVKKWDSHNTFNKKPQKNIKDDWNAPDNVNVQENNWGDDNDSWGFNGNKPNKQNKTFDSNKQGWPGISQGWGQNQNQNWGQNSNWSQPGQDQGWGQDPNQNSGWGQNQNQNSGWGQNQNQSQGWNQNSNQNWGQNQNQIQNWNSNQNQFQNQNTGWGSNQGWGNQNSFQNQNQNQGWNTNQYQGWNAPNQNTNQGWPNQNQNMNQNWPSNQSFNSNPNQTQGWGPNPSQNQNWGQTQNQGWNSNQSQGWGPNQNQNQGWDNNQSQNQRWGSNQNQNQGWGSNQNQNWNSNPNSGWGADQNQNQGWNSNPNQSQNQGWGSNQSQNWNSGQSSNSGWNQPNQNQGPSSGWGQSFSPPPTNLPSATPVNVSGTLFGNNPPPTQPADPSMLPQSVDPSTIPEVEPIFS